MNVYDQMSGFEPAGALRVGPELNTTLDAVKLSRFWMPGKKLLPVDLLWSKVTSTATLLAGPALKNTREGIRSNSPQPKRLPAIHTLLLVDCP